MNEFYKLKSTLTTVVRQHGELWTMLTLPNPKFFGNLPFIRPKFERYKKMMAEMFAFEFLFNQIFTSNLILDLNFLSVKSKSIKRK